MGLHSQKYKKLVTVDLYYLTMMIIIIIFKFILFLYTFLIFAVNKSNKVTHSKETNLFQFPTE